jgi:protein-S-isoprenylcysteine O-methyltransferase Ste14
MLSLFRCLLRLYPADFFREFAEEMTSVFCQRRRDIRHQGLRVGALFLAREFWGMVTGAFREHFTDDSFRRFDMRSFRFPRAMIVAMLVTLVSVGFAIERARQITGGGDTVSIWSAIPGVFGAMLCVTVILGLIGYGVLRALRQS